jgi:tetratricopeptide (TPR) repeat protein
MRSNLPRPLPALLHALLLALVLICADSPAIADSLADAQRLLKQGLSSQALEKVDTYLAGKPKEAQGQFLKGLILAEMGRPAEAIAVFSKLTEDYPELPEPYNNLAVLYARQKQYDKARTALEMAIRTYPGYATAYENLGDVHANLASQAYDKALQLDPAKKIAQTKLFRLRELISTAGVAAGKQVATIGEAGKIEATRGTDTTLTVGATTTPAARTTDKPAPLRAAETLAERSVPKAVDAVAALPRTPAPASGAEEAAVNRALQAWAHAWSRKDAKAYLAYYAADFLPPRGMSRKAWEIERMRPMQKPGKLLVEIEDIKVSFADDKATARFKQHYASPYLKSSVGKTMVLVRVRGRWLIQQERVGG